MISLTIHVAAWKLALLIVVVAFARGFVRAAATDLGHWLSTAAASWRVRRAAGRAWRRR